jgi:FkbM family methyltransferase
MTDSVEKSLVLLPDTLQSIEIRDDYGRIFQLVLGNPLGRYDTIINTAKSLSHLARFFIGALGGSGALIDIGANIGTVSIPVALAGNRVLALEMLPQNCLKFSYAMMLNHFTHVRLMQVAVSDTDGMLYYGGEEAWGQVQETGQTSMCLKLDTIVQQLSLTDPHFLDGELGIKIDIEGHEWQALKGAENLIKTRRPIIIFESTETTRDDSDPTRQCKIFLEQHAYRLWQIIGDVVMEKNSTSLQEMYTSDFVAIPAEKIGTLFQRGSLHQFQFRDPTPQERYRWILNDVEEGASLGHRQAAARAIAAHEEQYAEFSRLVADIKMQLSVDPLLYPSLLNKAAA